MRSSRPKVLHDACGAPVLEHVLDAAAAVEASPRVVVVGSGEDQVRARFAQAGLEWVSQPQRKGTGEAVQRCRKALTGFTGTALVLYGDVPLLRAETLRSLLARHRESGASATVLTCELADPAAYGRIRRDASGRMAGIVEFADASPAERAIREINSGLMALELPRAWEFIDGLRPNNRKGEYYLTDVVGAMLEKGLRVEGMLAADPEECLGVNTQAELAAAAGVIRNRVLAAHMANGVRVVAPALTWIETGVEIGPDTAVLPFSVIRRGVKIGAHCEVGPFAHLRAETVLDDHAEIGNFVEVKKSRIGSRSKAKHLTYLGDAFLGADVNIGAGTITANYDGKNKHGTIIEDGAFTGSGTVLVAPVRMGKASKTGAGAIVLRGHDLPDGQIVVGVPARPIRAAAPAGAVRAAAPPARRPAAAAPSAPASAANPAASRAREDASVPPGVSPPAAHSSSAEPAAGRKSPSSRATPRPAKTARTRRPKARRST